jgi:hypothetical protein
MIIVLCVVAWVILAITAYPLNKKWLIEDRMDFGRRRGNWTNGEMIWSFLVCLVGWWGVWTWFLVSKVSQSTVIRDIGNWFDRESIDTRISELFKKMFGRGER